MKAFLFISPWNYHRFKDMVLNTDMWQQWCYEQLFSLDEEPCDVIEIEEWEEALLLL